MTRSQKNCWRRARRAAPTGASVRGARSLVAVRRGTLEVPGSLGLQGFSQTTIARRPAWGCWSLWRGRSENRSTRVVARMHGARPPGRRVRVIARELARASNACTVAEETAYAQKAKRSSLVLGLARRRGDGVGRFSRLFGAQVVGLRIYMRVPDAHSPLDIHAARTVFQQRSPEAAKALADSCLDTNSSIDGRLAYRRLQVIVPQRRRQARLACSRSEANTHRRCLLIACSGLMLVRYCCCCCCCCSRCRSSCCSCSSLAADAVAGAHRSCCVGVLTPPLLGYESYGSNTLWPFVCAESLRTGQYL